MVTAGCGPPGTGGHRPPGIGRLLQRPGVVAPGPPLRVVVVTLPGGLAVLRAAVAVAIARVLGLRPGPLAAGGGTAGVGRGPARRGLVPPAGVAGVGPATVAIAGPAHRLIGIFTAPEPHAQKDGNENHDDDGCDADHEEQEHYTTQRAMATWVALARHTRPSTRAFPV